MHLMARPARSLQEYTFLKGDKEVSGHNERLQLIINAGASRYLT